MGGLLTDIFNYIDSGRASHAISQSDIAAEHGVLGATSDAQADIRKALEQANVNLPAAGGKAIGDVWQGTNMANKTLGDLLASEKGNLQPYLSGGAQGEKALTDYALSRPTFQFNPEQYFNSPAYQFELQQGTNAIQNSAAAGGRGLSGNTLKDLTKYGQGLGATYYNDAFNRQLSSFQTNQNTTLQNLLALTGTGETATGQFNQASQNASDQQARNTLGAGYFAGSTNLSLADTLAKLNVGGAETIGKEGMTGAQSAGNFAVGAGNARAAGIMGQGEALGGIGDSLIGMAAGGIGLGPAGFQGGFGGTIGDIISGASGHP